MRLPVGSANPENPIYPLNPSFSKALKSILMQESYILNGILTPLLHSVGNYPFYTFLKLGGCFEAWIEDCPLYLQ